jgi:hypothetical protein
LSGSEPQVIHHFKKLSMHFFSISFFSFLFQIYLISTLNQNAWEIFLCALSYILINHITFVHHISVFAFSVGYHWKFSGMVCLYYKYFTLSFSQRNICTKSYDVMNVICHLHFCFLFLLCTSLLSNMECISLKGRVQSIELMQNEPLDLIPLSLSFLFHSTHSN